MKFDPSVYDTPPSPVGAALDDVIDQLARDARETRDRLPPLEEGFEWYSELETVTEQAWVSVRVIWRARKVGA